MKLLKSRCFFTLATGFGLLTFAVFLILGRDGRLDVAKDTNLRFVNSLENEQIKRLKRIETSCQNDKEDDNLDKTELDHFIVDDKNKLIYCFVPKVACTNWKRVILSLRNQVGGNPLNIKGNESHLPELFQTLNQLNNEREVSDKLSRYLKFIFVRHPYERLLSAYRNKFEHTYSDYFRVRFGRKIIKQYRPNATLDSLNRGHDVTFPEFIRYVIDLNATKNGANFNEHWRPIKYLCFPCKVNFDIVGKYETLVSDAEYTLLRAGLANKVSFPRREQTYNLKPTTDLLKDYYSQIDNYLMGKLALIYKDDLEMFGYDKHLHLKS